jgi:hypothetical protein
MKEDQTTLLWRPSGAGYVTRFIVGSIEVVHKFTRPQQPGADPAAGPG